MHANLTKQRILMPHGEVRVPRLEAWYGSWAYDYSKGIHHPAAPVPDWLLPTSEKVAADWGPHDGIMVNLYRDGEDWIDWHRDDDFGNDTPTIPTLVLGAARPLKFRIRFTKERAQYLPHHGDLLVMRGRTNAEWEHSVPTTERDVGVRVSLTFRHKPTK